MEIQTFVQPVYKFESGRHLHSLDGRPLCGVTTVLSIMDKPGLTWWAAGMACGKMGWMNKKKCSYDERAANAEGYLNHIKEMDTAKYLNLLDEAYSAHNERKKDSADTGKDMHKLLEEFIKSTMGLGKGILFSDPIIQPFIDWTKKNVKQFLFSELYCYSKSLWCGGIADFGYIDMEDNYVLGDFKSSSAVYFTQWAQCGAYDILISENGGYTADGKKIYDAKFPFKYHAIFAAGMGLDNPTFNHNTIPTREAFCHALALYKSKLFFEGSERIGAK